IQDVSLAWPGSDKAAHFLVHLLLTGVIHRLLRRFRPALTAARAIGLAAIGSLSLGLLDEMQQFFVGGRDFDPFDIVANICGAATAAMLIAAVATRAYRIAVLTLLPLGVFAGVYAHSHAETKLFNAGILQIRAGDLAGAQRTFREAIARGQGRPALYNELAWLELEYLRGDPVEALALTTLAVQAEPDNPDFLDTHAWALHRNGRHQEALRFLQRALAAAPGIYCIHYHLGAVYHALGEDALAAGHLRRQFAVSETGEFAERARELLARITARDS
ncbi:MAG: VanZ family protein, partial [Gammaproteobacteria bacterium]